MKEGSEGDVGSDDVPTSRDADSTVSNGNINGSMVSSQPRRMLSDRPPSMGVVARASYEAEIAGSTRTEHANHPLGGTLANALLGNILDASRGSSGIPGNNGESIVGGIHSTNSNINSKNAKADNGQNRDKSFMCPTCHRCFGYKHVLQNHERTHTGEKPFECKECSKRFTRDHHLKTHMRLHTGEKPYHCSHCDRQFVQVANLRRHLRVHTGERPYLCHICSSRFSDSNQLKAHILIHDGKKPFHCEKCFGNFRRRHHLVHHKCPKDAANIGRPRRGRRPKAYEPLPPADTKPPLPMISPVLQERLSAPIQNLPLLPPSPPVSLTSVIKRNNSPPIQPPAAHMQVAHMRHLNLGSISNFCIVPSSNGRYHDEVQTGPIDMTVQSSVTSNSVSVIVPRLSQQNNNSHHRSNISSLDVVLDLSNSKSDSEAEPIEEEVDEEDDCLDEGMDSDSEEDEQHRLRMIPWNDEYIHRTHPEDLRRRNGDSYDSDGESSNLALQLTTS